MYLILLRVDRKNKDYKICKSYTDFAEAQQAYQDLLLQYEPDQLDFIESAAVGVTVTVDADSQQPVISPLRIPLASEITPGMIELATDDEAVAGKDENEGGIPLSMKPSQILNLIESGGAGYAIKNVSVNGEPLEVVNQSVNIPVPTADEIATTAETAVTKAFGEDVYLGTATLKNDEPEHKDWLVNFVMNLPEDPVSGAESLHVFSVPGIYPVKETEQVSIDFTTLSDDWHVQIQHIDYVSTNSFPEGPLATRLKEATDALVVDFSLQFQEESPIDLQALIIKDVVLIDCQDLSEPWIQLATMEYTAPLRAVTSLTSTGSYYCDTLSKYVTQWQGCFNNLNKEFNLTFNCLPFSDPNNYNYYYVDTQPGDFVEGTDPIPLCNINNVQYDTTTKYLISQQPMVVSSANGEYEFTVIIMNDRIMALSTDYQPCEALQYAEFVVEEAAGTFCIGDDAGVKITQDDITINGKSILGKSESGGSVNPEDIREELEHVFGDDLYHGVTEIKQVEFDEDYPWYNEPTETFQLDNNQRTIYDNKEQILVEYKVPGIYPAAIRNPWFFINYQTTVGYVNTQWADSYHIDEQGTYINCYCNFVIDNVTNHFDMDIHYGKVILKFDTELKELVDKILSISITLPSRLVVNSEQTEIITTNDKAAKIIHGDFPLQFDDNNTPIYDLSIITKAGFNVSVNTLEYSEEEIIDICGDTIYNHLSGDHALSIQDVFTDAAFDILVSGKKIEFITNIENVEQLDLIEKVYWSTPQHPGKVIVGADNYASISTTDIRVQNKSVLTLENELDKEFKNANVTISKPGNTDATIKTTLTENNSNWTIQSTTEPGYTVYYRQISNTGIDIDSIVNIEFKFNDYFIELNSPITFDNFFINDNFTINGITQKALMTSAPCTLYEGISTNLILAIGTDSNIYIIPDTDSWDYTNFCLDSVTISTINYHTYTVLCQQSFWERIRFGESSRKCVEIRDPNIVYSKQTKSLSYTLNDNWEITETEELVFNDHVVSILHNEYVATVSQQLTLHNTNNDRNVNVEVIVQSNNYIYLDVGSDSYNLWHEATNAPIQGIHIECPVPVNQVGVLTVGKNTQLSNDKLTIKSEQLSCTKYQVEFDSSQYFDNVHTDEDTETGITTVSWLDDSITCPVVAPNNYKIVCTALPHDQYTSGIENLSYVIDKFNCIDDSWQINVKLHYDSYQYDGEVGVIVPDQESTLTIYIRDGKFQFVNYLDGLHINLSADLANTVEVNIEQNDWKTNTDENADYFEVQYDQAVLQADAISQVHILGDNLVTQNSILVTRTNPSTNKEELCKQIAFEIDNQEWYDLLIFNGVIFVTSNNNSGDAYWLFFNYVHQIFIRSAYHTGNLVLGDNSGVLLNERDVIIHGQSINALLKEIDEIKRTGHFTLSTEQNLSQIMLTEETAQTILAFDEAGWIYWKTDLPWDPSKFIGIELNAGDLVLDSAISINNFNVQSWQSIVDRRTTLYAFVGMKTGTFTDLDDPTATFPVDVTICIQSDGIIGYQCASGRNNYVSTVTIGLETEILSNGTLTLGNSSINSVHADNISHYVDEQTNLNYQGINFNTIVTHTSATGSDIYATPSNYDTIEERPVLLSASQIKGMIDSRTVSLPVATTSTAGSTTLTSATGIDIYTNPSNYEVGVDGAPIMLTASQIKAMIDKAIQESGGGGESMITKVDTTMTDLELNLIADSTLTIDPINNP